MIAATVTSLMLWAQPFQLKAQVVKESFVDGTLPPALPGQNEGTGFGSACARESVYPGGNLLHEAPGSLTCPNIPYAGAKLWFFGSIFSSFPYSRAVSRWLGSSFDNPTLKVHYLGSLSDTAPFYYEAVHFMGSSRNLRLHLQSINVGDGPTDLLVEHVTTGKNLLAGNDFPYGYATLGPGDDSPSLWLNPNLLALASPNFTNFTLASFDYGSLTGIRIIGLSFDADPLRAIRFDEITVIPERSTALLLVGGLISLAWPVRSSLARA